MALIMSSVLPLDAKAIPRLGFLVPCLEDELGFGEGTEEGNALRVLDDVGDVVDNDNEDRGTDVDAKSDECPQTETKKHENDIQKVVMDDKGGGR